MSKRICKSIQQQLPDYLDSKLSVLQEDEIRRHLDSCRGCALVQQQFRPLMQELLPGLRQKDSSTVAWGQFLVGINERIDAVEQRRERAPWRTPALFLPAAAASLVVLAALLMISGIVDVSSKETATYTSLFSEDEANEIRSYDNSILQLESLSTVMTDTELFSFTESSSEQFSTGDQGLMEKIDEKLIAMFGTEGLASASLEYLDTDQILDALPDAETELLASALELQDIRLD